jgi:PAS domain S-box-containing protein
VFDRRPDQDHSPAAEAKAGRGARALQTAGVGVAMFVLAWVALTLIHYTDRVAPVWPANAVVLACLLRADSRRWPGFILSALVGNLAADLLAGDTLTIATGLSFSNTMEIVIGACGLRRLVGREVDLTRRRDLLAFALLAGFVAPLLSALFAMSWLKLPMGVSTAPGLITWVMADALGVVIIVPALLAITRAALRELWAPRAVKQNLLLLALLLTVTTCVFGQSRFPLGALVLPTLLFITFRLEFVGAALGVLVTAVISLGFAFAGRGPASLAYASPTKQAVALQIFLAIAFFCILPVASALARARQLKASLAASLAVAETARAESAEAQRWAGMAEQVTGVGYFRIANDGQGSTWSDEVYHIHGLALEDGPDLQATLDAVHPDDIEQVMAGIHAARDEGRAYSGEYRIRRPDGSWRNLSCRTISERGADGQITSVIGALLDITEFKQIEAGALESEARYRLLADKASDIISRSDPEGVLTYISPASQQMLGYAPEDLVGRQTMDFVHPDDQASLYQAFERQVDEGREHATQPTRYRFRNQAGAWVWLETHPTVVFDDHGELVEFVNVSRDITLAKAAEAELMAAREAAEAATLAKAEFLANMSHEIRTPLTSIMGFSSLLKETSGLPENALHYVQRISTAGQSLLSVVNDILDFSKLEAGQVELDPHPFAPAAFVQETLQLLAVQAANKGLDWRAEIDDALPALILADSARLRQVLLNLLGNAIKFTAKGSVSVQVGYEAQRLMVSVIDTGVGIPAERRDRLFQRFSQVDGSVSRIHGGTGLGLAICKTLVELMGGEIGVGSEEAQGSTFWFTIDAPAAEAALAEACDGALTGDEAEDFRPAHILIVDDLAVNRELVRAMLTPFGHSFEEADNGADAVRAALQSGFDLILMDLQMPGMDGFEAARTIRATATLNRTTPIVALSANVLPAHIVASQAAGMDDHLGKPIVPAQLVAKVAQWAGAEHEPVHAQAAAGGAV